MPDPVELLTQALERLLPLAQTEAAALAELGDGDGTYRLQAARAADALDGAACALATGRAYLAARDGQRREEIAAMQAFGDLVRAGGLPAVADAGRRGGVVGRKRTVQAVAPVCATASR